MTSENKMLDVQHLCIRYHQMYVAERAIDTAKSEEARTVLVDAYIAEKKLFDEQYKKVEHLLILDF